MDDLCPFRFCYAQKKCPSCGSTTVVKNGRQSGRQRSRCQACGRIFVRRFVRRQTPRWIVRAYDTYVRGKQTYRELSVQLGRDRRTIRKAFDRHTFVTGELQIPSGPLSVSMDVTYFDDDAYGVLVCRARGKNLAWREVFRREIVADYLGLLTLLEDAGADIRAVTVDGAHGLRHGVAQARPGYAVQLCLFHQIRAIRTYLPGWRRRHPAAQALVGIACSLPATDETTYTAQLIAWKDRWGTALAGSSKLRSAYRSLVRNTPWLFTFRRHPELHIPPTTNSCDGWFSHLKEKVRIHRGLSPARRRKLIWYLLEQG